MVHDYQTLSTSLLRESVQRATKFNNLKEASFNTLNNSITFLWKLLRTDRRLFDTLHFFVHSGRVFNDDDVAEKKDVSDKLDITDN